MQQKFVVTGALGHIGSRLIRHLAVEYPSCEIVILDNLKTQRFCSLFNLPDNVDFQFHETDVASVDLAPFVNDATAVIHLAAITDAAASHGNAEEVEAVNFQCTKKVAEACVRAGAPMIMASSTSVYGKQDGVVDEDCGEEDLQPQSPYADTKLKEENILKFLADEKGLRCAILRFGTIFGVSPGMRFHTAVNKFCWQASVGLPITVWKTAFHQKRPYLCLGDCVRAITHVIDKSLFDADIYNVLSENLSVKDVVTSIEEIIPDLTVKFVESPIMNQLSYEVQNEKFKATGFAFQGSSAAGIQETLHLLKFCKA